MAAKKSKSSTKARAATTTAATPVMPKRIYANTSPHSLGGVSLFDVQEQCNAETVANFFSEPELVNRAITRLQDAGFEVLQASPVTINFAGTPAQFERAFNTKLVAEERPTIKTASGGEETATFLDSPDTELPGLIATSNTDFADLLEGVALEEPRYYMAPSMFAPLKAYWHLRMPGDVSLAANADRAHRGGVTGRGVKVAMVDSGWYKHPYFVGRGYKVAPVVLGPAAANPLADESGHGTGESANIFAVAPDAELLPVKMSFVNSLGAFNTAVGLNPHIITCSWGSSNKFGPLSASDLALAAAVAAAVAAGITVVFAAGNGHWGFPGQHPDVISAGGVFMNPNESLRASDYASGFLSNIYPNRRVPDLSGLVGMSPGAKYLMLPVEANDQIDVGSSGGVHPNGDETANNDGWAAFSGTSAAAPQLAGAAALVKQACNRLKPAEIRDVLMKSARDVTVGNCSPSTGANPATVGSDLATGTGLVDAHKAVLLAKVRCLGPILPIVPIVPPVLAGDDAAADSFGGPVPVRPPIFPIPPIPPIKPPIKIKPPIITIRPRPPIRPIPIGPAIGPIIRPIINPAPFAQAEGAAPAAPEANVASREQQLSSDDVQALEELIVNAGLDLG